jgi:hypothetical protein
MTDPTAIRQDLTGHLALCRQILELVEREALALREAQEGVQFGFLQEKRGLLARLEASVDALRQRRQEWLSASAAQRAQHRDIEGLLRQNQDLIMKIIVLDRENEQNLLRRGLVPSRHLPPPNRQRPHFVADLYRRQGVGAQPHVPAGPVEADAGA